MSKLLSPEAFVDMAQYASYVENMSSLDQMDCWGLIELWHEYVFGIVLFDRETLLCSPEAIDVGRELAKDWTYINTPRDHSVALMKSNHGRSVFKYGHCGIIYKQKLYHIEQEHDFHCQDIRDRRVWSKITELRIHRELV